MFYVPEGFGTLNNLINSGEREVTLTSDIILNEFEEVKDSNEISIYTDDLVIDGNGHCIDARGKSGIFECVARNVTIKNITLKNGKWAIHNRGDLTLIKSKVTGNVSQHEDTIYNYGTLNIIESEISNNRLAESDAVIYNSGELTVEKSEISQNCGEKASAITNYEGNVTITGSTIAKNTAEEDGKGAISNFNGEIKITGTTFCENVRHGDGMIRNSQGTVTIEESTFEKNTMAGGAMMQNEGGGIIRLRSIFGRTADEEGDEDEFGKMTISKSTFAENTIENGDLIDNYYGFFTIDGSTFDKNAVGNGNMIKNRKGQFKIFDSTFTGNSAEFNVIFNDDSIQLLSTDFMANRSRFLLYNDSDEYDFGIDACKFLENDVEETVIFNNGKSCTISKATFQNALHDSINIINEGDMTIADVRMKDEGKSIVNGDYILINNLPREFEEYIENNGTIEFGMPPGVDKYDFGYLDRIIHESGTGEIVLEEDIRLETYEKDFYEGGMELDIDGLVIDGNGRTIDGAGKSRIFTVTAKDVTLKNITFTNGHSHRNYDNLLNSDGGALKVNGNASLTVLNCKFIENISESCGGAIQNNGGSLTVECTSIGENTADVNGAIRNNYGKVTIKRCEFNDNVGNYECGAVGNDKGEMDIINCKFHGNMSNGACGAIKNSKGRLTIDKSEILENATMSQGAICNMSEMHISESKIAKNIGNHRYGARYGAIFNEGNLTIASTLITENTSDEGGAIVNEGDVAITDSALTKNTAERRNGGAILNSGTAKLMRCEIAENAAEEYGGAIENLGRIEIEGGEISKNSSNQAGAIFNQKTAVITNAVFDENECRKDGFHDIFNTGKLVLKRPEFKACGKTILNRNVTYLYREIEDRIQNDGEFVYMDFGENQMNFSYLESLVQSEQKEILLGCDIMLDVSILEDEKYGEGILIDGDNVTIDGNGHTIDAKNLTRIFRTAGKNIVIKNVTLKNGHAQIDGGAIRNDGELILIEAIIMENKVDGQKGGAITNNDMLTIRECVFSNNTAEYGDGGAIYNGGRLNAVKSLFEQNCTKNGHGGAIYNMEGEMTIAESSFLKNTSSHEGGAILNGGVLTLTDSIFSENAAIPSMFDFGGAIANMGKLTMDNSRLTRNRALAGGAIYNSDGELTMIRSVVSENESANDGGAINSHRGNLKIINSVISENRAGRNGGAIRDDGGELTVENSELKNNMSESKGGAIYESRGKISIIESEIAHNRPDNVFEEK